jgi:hypothetical protein
MSDSTAKDLPPEYRHIDEQPWETLRWPAQESKMMFHPRRVRPSRTPVSFTTSRARIIRAIGTASPMFCTPSRGYKIGDELYGPGTMVFHPDPHLEEPLSTETGA